MTHRTTFIAIAALAALMASACTPEEPNEEQKSNSLFWKIDGTTYAETPILEECGIKDPYGINVFGSRIYVTTHSNYSANGDVYCFSMSGMRIYCGS